MPKIFRITEDGGRRVLEDESGARIVEESVDPCVAVYADKATVCNPVLTDKVTICNPTLTDKTSTCDVLFSDL